MCFGLDDGKCDDVFIGVLIARGLPARGLMASSSTQRWWRCWWQWWWWWKTLYPDVIISSSIMGDDRNEDIASCLKIIYRLASFYHDIALAIKFTNRPLNFKSHKISPYLTFIHCVDRWFDIAADENKTIFKSLSLSPVFCNIWKFLCPNQFFEKICATSLIRWSLWQKIIKGPNNKMIKLDCCCSKFNFQHLPE